MLGTQNLLRGHSPCLRHGEQHLSDILVVILVITLIVMNKGIIPQKYHARIRTSIITLEYFVTIGLGRRILDIYNKINARCEVHRMEVMVAIRSVVLINKRPRTDCGSFPGRNAYRQVWLSHVDIHTYMQCGQIMYIKSQAYMDIKAN